MVEDAVDLQLMNLPTAKTARTSWDAHGLIVMVDSSRTPCRSPIASPPSMQN